MTNYIKTIITTIIYFIIYLLVIIPTLIILIYYFDIYFLDIYTLGLEKYHPIIALMVVLYIVCVITYPFIKRTVKRIK